MAMHTPYAINTPTAREANTAEINTIDEFTNIPSTPHQYARPNIPSPASRIFLRYVTSVWRPLQVLYLIGLTIQPKSTTPCLSLHIDCSDTVIRLQCHPPDAVSC